MWVHDEYFLIEYSFNKNIFIIEMQWLVDFMHSHMRRLDGAWAGIFASFPRLNRHHRKLFRLQNEMEIMHVPPARMAGFAAPDRTK
jgi:hypothetical protein